MSYTTLCVIDKNGDVISGAEFHNSWGGAAFIWDALCKRYDVKDKHGYQHSEAWKILWDLVRDGEIELEPWEHNALFFTYDDAMIKEEDLQILAHSLEMFHTEHNIKNHVDHTSVIAHKISEYISDDNVCGVCLWATSVCENPWLEWNEKNEEYVPYNINTGNKHWFVEIK